MAICKKCEGCGKIASGEEGAPWSTWLALPLGSAAAVITGIVRPIVCPACEGKGSIIEMCQGCRFDTLNTEGKQMCAKYGIPTRVACIHKLTGQYEAAKEGGAS